MREVVRLANTLPGKQREELRAYLVGLLREEINDAGPATGEPGRPGGTFNPLGIGIPVFLMGGVLTVVFPPVGLLLLAVAAVLTVWGVVVAVVGGRNTRKR